MAIIQSVRGTKDLLPENINNWHFAENIFRRVSEKYSYQELRTPIFEKTEVFSRGIGEATEVVNKEMYTFTDRGGESLTLRPEMTAALVRAVIQNSMSEQSNILRLWYLGPFFRYERPQKGRLRQFHQYGAECIGSPYPESDAEVILLANSLIKNLGILDYKLLINSLGSYESRINYKEVLIKFLISVKNSLSADSQNRLEFNPLRVLDSKEAKDIEILKNAPDILDYLDEGSKIHFEKVLSLIDEAGIKYEINSRLVRGLDYYSHTVFEFQSSALGAQDSFGGGGRYNELFEQLGGKPTPAVGFAMGVERLIMILESIYSSSNISTNPDIFIVITNKELINTSMKISELLRNRGLIVTSDLLQRSIKAQLREANRFNSRYTLILGEEEMKRNQIILKNMITSEQKEIFIEELQNYNFE